MHIFEQLIQAIKRVNSKVKKARKEQVNRHYTANTNGDFWQVRNIRDQEMARAEETTEIPHQPDRSPPPRYIDPPEYSSSSQ
ncbi:hypothetical protein FRC03_007565 [Tulasnella sp. 419]|nr:hypothetical protein FRC02_001600 [Tulasnella sp. 418]KAG8959712.1 hypothetical protein FRC03_007565 [Tulasnella sp. 419]